MVYVSWQITWANSEKGGCTDCAIYSRYLTAGLEAFQSAGTQFIRPVLLNATASSNSSGNLLIEDLYIRLAAKSQFSKENFSRHNPLMNFNRNIDNQQGKTVSLAADGGRLVRPILIQDGYLHEDGRHFLRGIVVDDLCPNVSIEGGFYLVPDVLTDNETPGVITNAAPGLVVDGFTSWADRTSRDGISSSTIQRARCETRRLH